MTNASTILFLVVDDLGTADLGYTGSKFARRSSGAARRHGPLLCAARVYSNTRGAVTGGTRCATASGVRSLSLGRRTAAAERDAVPQLLRSAATPHAIGKWHLGFYRWEHTPTSAASTHTTATTRAARTTFRTSPLAATTTAARRLAALRRRLRPGAVGRTERTRRTSSRARRRRRPRHAETKLYLYLATQAVHCPAQAPPEYVRPTNESAAQRLRRHARRPRRGDRQRERGAAAGGALGAQPRRRHRRQWRADDGLRRRTGRPELAVSRWEVQLVGGRAARGELRARAGTRRARRRHVRCARPRGRLASHLARLRRRQWRRRL